MLAQEKYYLEALPDHTSARHYPFPRAALLTAGRARLDGVSRSPVPALLSSFLALALLVGCQPSSSKEARKEAREDREDGHSIPKPSAAQLLESTAPGYAPLDGTQQECLGRLVFDVINPVEWPVVNGSRSETFEGRSFSKDVRDGNDRLRVGNVDIATVKLDQTSNLQKFTEGHENAARYRAEELRSSIKRREESIKERQARLEGSTGAARLDIESAQADDIADLRKLQASLAEVLAEWKPLDLGIPNSFGFWRRGSPLPPGSGYDSDGSYFYAYIERNGYIYAFKAGSKLDKASHQKEFLAFLKRWRPRAAGEIPNDLGICIPYGFIADDGKSTIFNRMSIRYADAPGVLYTIQTSNVDPKLGPETTTLTAAGRALAGHIGGYEQELVDKYVTKKIGPQIVKIGALTAQQGGFAAQKPDSEGKPMNVYSVFTGYGGWQDTFVLPSILVDMRSYTRLEAPELTVNPPPFEQSMERLNALLKSIRLRPTSPPMPELAGLPK